MTKKSKKKKSKKPITVQELITQYEQQNELSAVYVKALRCWGRRFSKYLGRDATTNDFKHKIANAWMQHERENTTYADKTRHGGRVSLKTLWKFSGRKLNHEKLRNVKVARKNPQAWTGEERTKVFAAAKMLPGRFPNGVSRSLYMATLLQFAYETGLRRSDILAFDISTLDGNVASLTMNKTRRVHLVEVSDDLLADMQEIHRILTDAGVDKPNTVFRLPLSESQLYYWMLRIRVLANVDVNVKNRALQHQRRNGATDCRIAGEDASGYLGHQTRDMADKSYVDAEKTRKPISPVQVFKYTDKDNRKPKDENNGATLDAKRTETRPVRD